MFHSTICRKQYYSNSQVIKFLFSSPSRNMNFWMIKKTHAHVHTHTLIQTRTQRKPIMTWTFCHALISLSYSFTDFVTLKQGSYWISTATMLHCPPQTVYIKCSAPTICLHLLTQNKPCIPYICSSCFYWCVVAVLADTESTGETLSDCIIITFCVQ